MSEADLTTRVTISMEDMLDFGREYEEFSDLLRDRVAEQEYIEYADEVLIYGYSFHAVLSVSEVVMTVHYVVEGDNDPVYVLTPKGKMTALLMGRGFSYEAATEISDECFSADEVES